MMTSPLRDLPQRVINFVLFYLGWIVCIEFAKSNYPLVGPAVVALILCYHLFITTHKLRELLLMVFLTVIGTMSDTFYIFAGLIEYRGGYVTMGWLAPLWLSSLWALFATTFNSSLFWLRGRMKLSAFLGFFCGPATYFVGEELGAIAFLIPYPVVLGVLAIFWACLIPVCLWLARRLQTTAW